MVRRRLTGLYVNVWLYDFYIKKIVNNSISYFINKIAFLIGLIGNEPKAGEL